MMKLFKCGFLSLILFVACVSTPVMAGPVRSNTEFELTIAIFIEKMNKIKGYVDEINETTDVIQSFGSLGRNAAHDIISEGADFMKGFEDSIHFGTLGDVIKSSTAYTSVAGTVSDIQGTVNNVNGAINDVRGSVGAVQGIASGSLDAVKDAVLANVQNGQVEQEGAAVPANNQVASENNTPPAAQKGTAETTIFGAPQPSIEDAQKYVKDQFFYSIKKGDKNDGDPLTGTTAAQQKVSANRYAYYEEVIASTYGQSLEAASTSYEESKKRIDDLANKIETLYDAKEYDDKKAVEVAIMQNDTRERMQRLSLELGLLELESVRLLFREPEQYIIARSVEEIKNDAKEKLDAVNLLEEGENEQ